MIEKKPRVRWNSRNQRWQTHSEKWGFMRYFLMTCAKCREPYIGGGCSKLCVECSLQMTEKRDRVYQKAHSAVTKAIRHGQLPRLDGTILCADCGRTAEAYDHRDYSKPLDVSPVCRSCNSKRGHGKGVEQHSLRSFAKRLEVSK